MRQRIRKAVFGVGDAQIVQRCIERSGPVIQRIAAQRFERPGKRRLASFTQLLSNLHESATARFCRVESSPLEIDHHKVLVRLKFVHAIARGLAQGPRFFE